MPLLPGPSRRTLVGLAFRLLLVQATTVLLPLEQPPLRWHPLCPPLQLRPHPPMRLRTARLEDDLELHTQLAKVRDADSALIRGRLQYPVCLLAVWME